MANGTENRRLQNIENAARRQQAVPPTNSSVRDGATTTGRAGANQIREAQEESGGVIPPDTITLNIHKPTVTASPGGGNGVLRYPKEPGIDSNSDYVIFSFFKYMPPFGGGKGGVPAVTRSSQNSGGYSNYQSSNNRSYNNISDEKPIILYMPEDINSQFGAGWNGAGFGAAAIGLMNIAGSATDQKDYLKLLQAAAESVSGSVKAAAFNGIVTAINAAAGADISLNRALGTITGTILNPNVELAYEAPKLRTFSLKFKLVPRTAGEAAEIKKICNRFKKVMLPKFGGQAFFGTTEAANLITIPDLCQVSFMNGNNLHSYLPQYKLCGITDVNINYTAAGAYATYGNSSPVATELTISFIETKLIFSQEIAEEGPSL